MKNCALLLLFLLTNTWAGISQEEVFVHTDRDVYQAGESLKFKVYVLSNNEQNCQVEWLNILLVDQSGDLQFENRIAIKNCMVIGEIVLPGSFPFLRIGTKPIPIA